MSSTYSWTWSLWSSSSVSCLACSSTRWAHLMATITLPSSDTEFVWCRAGCSNAERHFSLSDVKIIPWIDGEVHFPLELWNLSWLPLLQFVHFKNVCPPPPSPSSILLDGSWRWPRWVNLGFLLAPFEPMIEPLTQGGDSILNPDRRNFFKFNNLYLLFSTVFHGLVCIYLTNALFTFLVILYLPYLKQLRLIALSIFSSQVPQSSYQQPQKWFRHSYRNIEAAHTK